MILLPAQPAPPAPREERASLPERLQGYARYLALMADELAALEQRDERRLQLLDAERLRLARELTGTEPDAPPPPPHLELYVLLREGLEEIERHVGQEEQEREMWDHLESGALRAAHRLRVAVVRPGEYRPFPGGDAKVDVRL
jgi:hypothetical protein